MRLTLSAWRAYWRTRNQFARQAGSASLFAGSPPSSAPPARAQDGGGTIARPDVPPPVVGRDVRSERVPPRSDRTLVYVCLDCGGEHGRCGCPAVEPGEERFVRNVERGPGVSVPDPPARQTSRAALGAPTTWPHSPSSGCQPSHRAPN